MKLSKATVIGTLLLILALAGFCRAEEVIRVRPLDWAQPVLGTHLKNCYKVSNDLYRSEQPNANEMKELERMGIKSVLSLRDFHDDSSKAAGTGIRVYHVSMSAGKMDITTLRQAMRIIRDAPKPILIHCWHGSDRTGAIVALYRMGFENWPREKAIDELVNGGFGFHKSVYPNIVEFLRTVDVGKVVSR